MNSIKFNRIKHNLDLDGLGDNNGNSVYICIVLHIQHTYTFVYRHEIDIVHIACTRAVCDGKKEYKWIDDECGEYALRNNRNLISFVHFGLVFLIVVFLLVFYGVAFKAFHSLKNQSNKILSGILSRLVPPSYKTRSARFSSAFTLRHHLNGCNGPTTQVKRFNA